MKNEKLKKRIKEVYKHQKLFAESIKMNPATVSALVNNKHKPTKNTAARIASSLQCNVSDVFDEYVTIEHVTHKAVQCNE